MCCLSYYVLIDRQIDWRGNNHISGRKHSRASQGLTPVWIEYLMFHYRLHVQSRQVRKRRKITHLVNPRGNHDKLVDEWIHEATEIGGKVMIYKLSHSLGASARDQRI